MEKTKKTEKVVKTDHPLEEFFGIEEGSTDIVEYTRETKLVEAEEYDDKDNEIEGNYQEIFDRAMEGYEVLVDEMEDIDPKYVARVGEVSIQHLNMALNAAKSKATLKTHKDKLSVSEKTSPKTINNTLVIDRNDLVKQLLASAESEAIMAENDEDIIDVDSDEEPEGKE